MKRPKAKNLGRSHRNRFMTKKQVMLLARAFAPEDVKEQLDHIEELENKKRTLQADINGSTRFIMDTVRRAEIHHANPPPHPLTPLPAIPDWAKETVAIAP